MEAAIMNAPSGHGKSSKQRPGLLQILWVPVSVFPFSKTVIVALWETFCLPWLIPDISFQCTVFMFTNSPILSLPVEVMCFKDNEYVSNLLHLRYKQITYSWYSPLLLWNLISIHCLGFKVIAVNKTISSAYNITYQGRWETWRSNPEF